ncbi:TatD family hydrolase [Acidocella aminolytica]|jgi:TatD DNase family protein|uniref:Deoxyribonuclease TatD n=1 Tax=Acidocella aminolytica 101 = DSM 11237 TaxID=1120923 RepID=A0A0D6PDZ1_9PROT|nr:TatD family hydrolase [Acidocella aminolytica]GAN79418.1 deoxyribonuclease TatD [Acidocella aminolytica 101 = DSM 11237]GBQ43875.1 deoxyribonuclease TatD [Acidocella aminolytica 101 = DSM 11237]SHE45449.1 TatD DNase family protein [Acidocella aminolytica 101 = DSM 11237]
MLVDSHCHLDYFNKPGEQAEIIARAVEAGVQEMVTIGVTLKQSQEILSIAAQFENVWACVGVHPNHAADVLPVVEPEVLAKLAEHPKVVGIGESGLDYFYDNAPKDVQEQNFRANIRAARLVGLPICIHARDADADIARILREERAGGHFEFLLHCFSSSRQLAEDAMEMGGYFSFSGILTFPKGETVREVAAIVPEDRILVETDSPYLAPVPHRGQRNEPAYTAHTAAKLAEVRGLSSDALAELTTRNFRTLFKKAVR